MSLEKKIEEIFKQHNIEIPYQFEESTSESTSYAAYNQEKDLIIFRTDSLAKEMEQLKEVGIDLKEDDFCKIIVFHEVGHAKDQNIHYFHEEKKKILKSIHDIQNQVELDRFIEKLGNVILQSELNAWRFVENHLTTTEAYKQYKKRCLDFYIAYLERLYAVIQTQFA